MEVREKEEGAWPVLNAQKGQLALVGIWSVLCTGHEADREPPALLALCQSHINGEEVCFNQGLKKKVDEEEKDHNLQ